MNAAYWWGQCGSFTEKEEFLALPCYETQSRAKRPRTSRGTAPCAPRSGHEMPLSQGFNKPPDDGTNGHGRENRVLDGPSILVLEKGVKRLPRPVSGQQKSPCEADFFVA